MDQKLLPPSLVVEKRAGLRLGILLTAALFILTFFPWTGADRELFSHEGFFAAIASEYLDSENFFHDGIAATAHHEIAMDAYPVYPAVVAMVNRLGVPMESALRIVSVAMLGVLSLLVGIAAASRSNYRAGIVGACCCFGTLFALEKGIVGGPETMAACFLFSAQLLFFHYGSRLADWNSAWISAAVLLSLGFLTAGIDVVLFFAVPLLFLRRPLSSSGKFRTSGFAAGAVLLAAVILSWALPIGVALRQYATESGLEAVSLGKYLQNVLAFFVSLPFVLLPWSILMWLPFCVALQAVLPLPVLGLYLRTLVMSSIALGAFLPGGGLERLFYVIGPLAMLTGLYYELGVRRYGVKLRKFITAGSLFFPLAGIALLTIYFLPEKILDRVAFPVKFAFRSNPDTVWLTVSAIGFFAVLALIFNIGIRKFPFWINLLLFCFGISVAAMILLLPQRAKKDEWRKFGSDVRKVLPHDVPRIYKYDIHGMYNGLFYVGKPVYKLRKDERLPETEKQLYVISPRFPDLADWSWRPLLPKDYTCRGIPISLWQGTRIPHDADEVHDE